MLLKSCVNTKRSNLRCKHSSAHLESKSGVLTDEQNTDRWPPIAFETLPVYHIPHSPDSIRSVALRPATYLDTITRQRPKKGTGSQSFGIGPNTRKEEHNTYMHADSIVTGEKCKTYREVDKGERKLECSVQSALESARITSGVGGALGLATREMCLWTSCRTSGHPSYRYPGSTDSWA